MKKPTPEALEAIPDSTCRNWPNAHLLPPGTILAKHLLGCRTSGGRVDPRLCPHCNRNVEWRYRCALAHLDALARGR